MLAPLLVFLAQGGGGPPLVTASVDRAHLSVGDALVLTVRARTRAAQPLAFTLPSLSGFAIAGTHEVTDVAVGEGAGPSGQLRITVRQVRLRAVRAGTLTIGPVRARQGAMVVLTRPISVTVDSASTPPGALGPPARALLDAAASPVRGDDVTVQVLVPGDTVLAGHQLDIVVAAWFPREVRLRLSGQPQITLPTPPDVWSYPEEVLDQPAASRLVRGRWMDAFVAHRVVFPLEPGGIMIPRASVQFGMPLSFSIFSREQRYTLRSDSVSIVVRPLPAAGRPADDQGLAAEALKLTLGMTPADTRVDEPITAVVTLSGIGNVPLWPQPVVRWPQGFRVYPTETDVRLEPQGGLVAGSKAFSYLVVPDSTGTFVVPEARYAYYDVATGGYAVARAAPQTLVVLPGAEPRAARALPPLLGGSDLEWADAVAGALSPWGWIALVLGPPFLAWITRRRRAAGTGALERPTPESRLGRLEREFHGLLASHVSDRDARDGDGLARALRAAGIDSAVADHVMRLRDRLRAARYGPGGPGDAAELAAELERVLHVLGADPIGGRRRRLVAALAAVALCGAGRVTAQGPTAEALYDAGALRAAADSFAARAAREPRVAAHWYNLGATLYRAAADGKALAAWTIAAHLAPRDPVIARARALLAPPDAASDPLLAVGVATPVEWGLAAALAWLALWCAVLTRRSRITVVICAAVAVAAGALCARQAWQDARPVAVVVGSGTPVRVAPYGSASAATHVDAGAALLVARGYGRWLEVARADGVHGWVLASEVVRP